MLFHAHLHGGYMKSTSARPCRCCSTQERGRRDAQPARHRLKRREAAAVPLRRSDLAYTKQLSFLVTGTELNLHTQLAGVSKEVRHLHPGVLNTHRRRLQAAEQSSMQVHLQVEGTGGVDHFVRIAIKGTLRLQCGACLGPCSWHINTGTQVWLNSRPRAAALGESDDPDEIIFPVGANELDLGPYVVDALVLALPGVVACGADGCMAGATAGVGLDGQGSGWRIGASSANKRVSPFGALLALQKETTKTTKSDK